MPVERMRDVPDLPAPTDLVSVGHRIGHYGERPLPPTPSPLSRRGGEGVRCAAAIAANPSLHRGKRGGGEDHLATVSSLSGYQPSSARPWMPRRMAGVRVVWPTTARERR